MRHRDGEVIHPLLPCNNRNSLHHTGRIVDLPDVVAAVGQPHGVATGIQIPVVVKQSTRVRHQGIWREELAAPKGHPRVVVAGVVVLQARAVAFRGPFGRGETLVGDTDTAVAGTAIGKVPFIRDDGIALIGGQDRAA